MQIKDCYGIREVPELITPIEEPQTLAQFHEKMRQQNGLLEMEVRRLHILADSRFDQLESLKVRTDAERARTNQTLEAKTTRIDELIRELGRDEEAIRRQGEEIDALKKRLAELSILAR